MVFYVGENLGDEIKIDSLVYSSRSYHIFNAYNGLGLRHMALYKGAIYIPVCYHIIVELNVQD